MKKKNYVTYVLIIGILFAFFLSGCSSKQNSEVSLAETVGIPTAILFLWIVFGYVFLGAIFGVATHSLPAKGQAKLRSRIFRLPCLPPPCPSISGGLLHRRNDAKLCHRL